MDHKPAATLRTTRSGFRVADDLTGMPVSDEELDVVEAFLMAAFRAVMANESTAPARASGDCDSEMTQTRAEIRPAIRGRERERRR